MARKGAAPGPADPPGETGPRAQGAKRARVAEKPKAKVAAATPNSLLATMAKATGTAKAKAPEAGAQPGPAAPAAMQQTGLQTFFNPPPPEDRAVAAPLPLVCNPTPPEDRALAAPIPLVFNPPPPEDSALAASLPPFFNPPPPEDSALAAPLPQFFIPPPPEDSAPAAPLPLHDLPAGKLGTQAGDSQGSQAAAASEKESAGTEGECLTAERESIDPKLKGQIAEEKLATAEVEDFGTEVKDVGTEVEDFGTKVEDFGKDRVAAGEAMDVGVTPESQLVATQSHQQEHWGQAFFSLLAAAEKYTVYVLVCLTSVLRFGIAFRRSSFWRTNRRLSSLASGGTQQTGQAFTDLRSIVPFWA